MSAWMVEALAQTRINRCFRAVPKLRPASLSDRKVPRDDAFFRYRPSTSVEEITAHDRPPSLADVTQHSPTTSAASLRPSQRAHGRPLKEDSLKMTQLCGIWMHLFLPLILLGKLRDKIGKEILKHLMTHKNTPVFKGLSGAIKTVDASDLLGAILRRSFN